MTDDLREAMINAADKAVQFEGSHGLSDAVDAILALLKERGLTIEPDWQPAETAPNGGRVLVYQRGQGVVEREADGDWWRMAQKPESNITTSVIAWKPLPRAPSPTGSDHD